MPPEPDFDQVCEVVRERLPQNERIRRNLPGGGRLRLDRQLPFLCVYRQPPGRDDPGTRDLVTTEAAYLVAPGGEEHRAGLSRLCRTIGETLQEHFGVLLLLEVWAEDEESPEASDRVRRPAFEVVAAETDLPTTIEAFQQALERIRIDGRAADVRVVTRQRLSPSGMPPLTEAWLAAAQGASDGSPACSEAASTAPGDQSLHENMDKSASPRPTHPAQTDDDHKKQGIQNEYHEGSEQDLEKTIDGPQDDAAHREPSGDDEQRRVNADQEYAIYRAGCFYLGLAVRPIYRDPHSGTVYPVILQQLRRQLSRALRKAIFAFTGIQTIDPKLHFDSLGPSTMVKDSRLVDLEMCEVSESFDLILQATPINAESAWQEFRDDGYRTPPSFQYRPLPYHPELLKRRLYEVPLEKVEDPTLAYLFAQKQVELDRQISALRDLDTPNFMLLSLQIYGRPSEPLLDLARQIVGLDYGAAELPGEEDDDDQPDYVHAERMVERVREEFDYYHALRASFTPRVEVCGDIASGTMVAGERLFVSETFHTPATRVEPLLHHEVGTHLLTYFNGREQVLRQLYAGLAGYEGLQEGLAMLAEYCSGGLTLRRLRTIAGRVLAIGAMIDGESFVDVFHLLHETYRFGARAAFVCALRAFRGGGLTKDIIYLRGFQEVLDFLAKGHELEPLFVGKIALEHVPFVQELRRRGIVQAPALLPRYWEQDAFRTRLEECRNRSVMELVAQPARHERRAS